MSRMIRPSRAQELELAPNAFEQVSKLERLRGENAALKRGASEGVRMKASEMGAPLGLRNGTLYKEQWLKLPNTFDGIRAFIAENARLKAKD
jgi:hypothetical protein